MECAGGINIHLAVTQHRPRQRDERWEEVQVFRNTGREKEKKNADKQKTALRSVGQERRNETRAGNAGHIALSATGRQGARRFRQASVACQAGQCSTQTTTREAGCCCFFLPRHEKNSDGQCDVGCSPDGRLALMLHSARFAQTQNDTLYACVRACRRAIASSRLPSGVVGPSQQRPLDQNARCEPCSKSAASPIRRSTRQRKILTFFVNLTFFFF